MAVSWGRVHWLMATALMTAVLAIGCGGGEDGGADDGSDDEVAVVDNCTLLTDDEVSSLSSEPLVADQDSVLGCGWIVEGGTIAEFSIRSFTSDASAAERAAEVAPSLDVLGLDGVGDDAVALVSDGEANFIMAKRGSRGVEMVMTFLDVEVDSDNFQRAQELANQALGRLPDVR